MKIYTTQAQIIGFIFGLFFTFSKEDFFLTYIAPHIQTTAPNIEVSVLIDIIGLLVFIGSLVALWRIIKNIEKTHTLTRGSQQFDKYLLKLIITATATIVLAAILKNRLL